MPQHIKDKLAITVGIPVWQAITGALGFAILLAYYGGGMVTKLDQLIDIVREFRGMQVAQQEQINRINERQINGLATLSNHEQQIRSLDARVSNLEGRR